MDITDLVITVITDVVIPFSVTTDAIITAVFPRSLFHLSRGAVPGAPREALSESTFAAA
jgi:hypothetical protein